MGGKGWLIALISLAVIGVVLVCIGCGLIPFFKGKITPEVDKNVVLKNATEGYKAWLSPHSPIDIDFYFFHVLNPQEIVHGAKPQVEQRGPYVYRETRKKMYVEFSENETELFYREGKWYEFDAQRSNGSTSDNITTLDIFLLTLSDKMRYTPDWLQRFMRSAVRAVNGSLFTQKSVHELLWGYTPDVISKLKAELPRWLRWLVPKVDVGFYVGENGNGTDSGSLEISTGVGNISQLGVVRSWKGSRTLSFWSSDICNMINGTDGTLWHPFISREERLYVFISEMCRSVYLEYMSDSTVSSSHIPVYQYHIPPELLANTSINPDNAGFCTPDGHCMKAGVLNVSNCRDNVPLVMSQPHFLDADTDYQESIEGLHPHDSSLRTVIEVEPTTGVVMRASKKLQMNMYVRRALKCLEPTTNLTQDYVFPMFWVNEHGEITDDDAGEFKRRILEPMTMSRVLLFSLIGLGAFFIVISIIISVVICVKHAKAKDEAGGTGGEDDEPLITDA